MRTDMTPEVIKAAREYERLDDVYSGHQSPSAWEVMPIAATLASFVLKHEKDYDAEGNPLPVDEGFAKALGFEGPADEDGFFWRKIPGGKVGVDCTPQYPSLMFVDADGDQTIFPAPKTRPQLRALIQSLRGSQE